MFNFLKISSIKPNVKMNTIILFTNARDEPNIAEWVAHHLILGFNKIVIFDHLSKIPISMSIGTTFNNKLEVIKVDGSGNIKINLMNRALEMSQNQGYEWMLYLDADEFINLNNLSSIHHFLKYFKSANSIGINWLLFGTSGHVKQPNGLLTENFIKSDSKLNNHVKTIVRPHNVRYCNNPHFYVMDNSNKCYSGNGTKMAMCPFNKQPMSFLNAPIYIAHYYTQSEEEYLRRKTRICDDGTSKQVNIKNIHNSYNDSINEQLKTRYSGKIKLFLQNYNIDL